MSDSTYQPKIYREQGGNKLVVAPGGQLQIEGAVTGLIPGDTYFVDSATGSSAYDGLSWSKPKATLAQAVALATAGDVIYVAAGHSETLAAAVTLSTAGVTIIGMGEGNKRPAFVGGAIDYVSMEAADCVVENLKFTTPSASAGVFVNIAAARCVARGCKFEQGANCVDAITITAAGELPIIEKNEVIVGANGPHDFILFEGVVDRPIIRFNYVLGSDGTNPYDDGVINIDSNAITNPIVYRNIFLGGNQTTTVIANDSSTGACYGSNVYAGGATNADNTTEDADISDALCGAGGVASWPGAAAYANNVSVAEVVAYVQDGVRKGSGSAMPANKSIYDVTGAFTGGGAAQDGSIKASLDLVHSQLSGTDGIATWPTPGVAPGNGVSIAEAIRYIVENIFGTLAFTGGADAKLTTILGDLANDSLVARLNDIGSDVNGTTTDSIQGKIGTDTEMSDRSLYDLINGGGPAAAAAAAAPANDVSLYAVVRDIWDALRNGTGGAEPASNRGVMDYLGVTPAFFVPGLGYRVSKAEDANSAGADLFTVTGKVLITLMTGEVTNALGAAAVADYVLKIKTTDEALCAATTITADALGTMYVLGGDVGDTLNGGGTPTTRLAELNGKGLTNLTLGLASGSATICSAHTATGDAGDQITWSLFYLPLEAGASVAAA